MDLERHVEHVANRFEQAGNLDREAPAPGVQRTGGHQQVGALEREEDLLRIQPVAVHQHRVEDDLDLFLAVADDLGLEHARDALDLVAQIPRQPQQRALRHITAQGHHQDREQAEVDLVDRRLVGVLGQVRLDQIDPFAHVGEGRVDVEAGVEFHQHAGAALEGGGAYFLDALDAPELGLHGADQQPFRVLRRDAVVTERDVDDRNVDVGIGLLGNGNIGRGAGDQQQ